MAESDLTHVRQMWADDAASRDLGIELVDVGIREGRGFATSRWTVGAAHVNGHDIAHGGYLFLVADSTFALACNATGQLTVAAGADINFVTAAHLGDELEIVATERIRYGRNGITDVTVTRGATLVAEFRGRSRAVHTGKAVV